MIDQGGWADHEGGQGPVLGPLGLGKTTPLVKADRRYDCARLQRLPQTCSLGPFASADRPRAAGRYEAPTHVIRQHPVQAEPAEEREPIDALLLVGPQLGPHRERQLDILRCMAVQQLRQERRIRLPTPERKERTRKDFGSLGDSTRGQMK